MTEKQIVSQLATRRVWILNDTTQLWLQNTHTHTANNIHSKLSHIQIQSPYNISPKMISREVAHHKMFQNVHRMV